MAVDVAYRAKVRVWTTDEGQQQWHRDFLSVGAATAYGRETVRSHVENGNARKAVVEVWQTEDGVEHTHLYERDSRSN